MTLHPHSLLALIGPIGWPELLIIAILGVIIFGKRLPEVGKSVGKGIVEFKRGLSGIENDINHNADASKNPYSKNRIEGDQAGQTLHTDEAAKQTAKDRPEDPSA